MIESRTRRIAFYAIPMLFCLAVHWIAIKTWFQADDFAWLGLPLEIHPTLHDWVSVLFEPRAQGTIRILSERVYFLIFTSIFGLNALPFRIWAFLTQFANLFLLMRITRRVTGSDRAAFIAPILWAASSTLTVALDWSSAYNEVCCAFFLLLSFDLLLRYFETGERKYWIWQFVTFVLGFGALELMVVYPAVAAAYALLFAPKYFRRTLWLFLPSLVYTAIHFAVAPLSHDPNYRMHFDPGIARIFWDYWALATAAWRPTQIDWRPVWLETAAAIAISLGFLWCLYRNRRLAAFCLGWFVLVIAPLLPLTNHFSEYYASMPAIGLAMLGGWAVSRYPRVAGPLALLYLTLSITDIYVSDKFFYTRARLMKKLVLGLEENRPLYEGKMVLLSGVNSDWFWSGFYDDPFRLIGISDIRLVPGSEKTIDPHPEWGGIDRFKISLNDAVNVLDHNGAEVFHVSTNGLQDITPAYRALARAELRGSRRDIVDAGDPAQNQWLGPGWYNLENGYRWMGKSATVRIGGTSSRNPKLELTGFCSAAVVAKGPVRLTVGVDGQQIGTTMLKQPNQEFDLTYPLPANLAGKSSLTISLEVNRTVHIGQDKRDLGLIFGTFTMK